MDAKITKERIGQFLSYDWVKVVAVIVAAVFLWMMLFSGLETDITAAQRYDVYNYLGTTSTPLFKTYSGISQKGVLSYEVMESRVMNLPDYPNDYDKLMLAAVTLNEVDALFVPDIEGDGSFSYTDDKGQTKVATYLETVVYKYYADVLKMNGEKGLFALVENYLAPYYPNGYADPTALNKTKVEEDFRANVKREKDKRYKTEESIQAALPKEYARIESYARALVEFKGYLQNGIVAVDDRTYYLRNSVGDLTIDVSQASINLCVDETKTDLTDLAYYTVGEGENAKPSSKDLHIVLFKQPAGLERFTGDHLLFVNEIIRGALVS